MSNKKSYKDKEKRIETLYNLRVTNRPKIIPDTYLDIDKENDENVYSKFHEFERKYKIFKDITKKYEKNVRYVGEKSIEYTAIPQDRIYVKNYKNEIIYEVPDECITKIGLSKVNEEKLYLSLYYRDRNFLYGIFFLASPEDFINMTKITEYLYKYVNNKKDKDNTIIKHSEPYIIEKKNMKYKKIEREFNIAKKINDYQINLNIDINEDKYDKDNLDNYNYLLKYINIRKKYKKLNEVYEKMTTIFEEVDLRSYEEKILIQKPYNIIYPISEKSESDEKYKKKVDKFIKTAKKSEIDRIVNYLKKKIEVLKKNDSNKSVIIIKPVHKLFRDYDKLGKVKNYIHKDSSIFFNKKQDSKTIKKVNKLKKISIKNTSIYNYDDFITITEYVHYYYKYFENAISRKSKYKDHNIYLDYDTLKMPVINKD